MSATGGIVFEGDPTDHGGYVLTASSTIVEGGRRAALIGDMVRCPRDEHGVNPIVYTDSTMFDKGRLVVTHGARAECGCIIHAVFSKMNLR